MTSKRTIKRDFEDVTEDIVEELDPEDRTQLCIEAASAGRDDLVDWLKETAPTRTYNLTDPVFIERLRDAFLLSTQAWHELERGTWQYHLAYFRGQYHKQLAKQHDVTEWEFIEEPSPDNDFLEGEAMDAAAEFLVDYRAWERFADKIFKVDLNSFLALAAPDEWVENIEIMAMLADGRQFDEEIDGWAMDREITRDGETWTIDEAADRKVSELVTEWEKSQA